MATKYEQVEPSAKTTDEDLKSESVAIAIDSKNVKAVTENGKESELCTLSELYQYCDREDYILMFFGTVAAIATGFCQPAFCLLFGYAMDDLNSGDIQASINKLAIFLTILGVGNLITATVQTGCWGIAGERLAQKFREKYVNAVLSQEIGWFDKVGANQLATRLSDLTGQLRDGLTYKTADFIQFLAQVIGSCLVGLALDPYVALIMFACTPLIGGAAAVWIGSIAAANKGTSEQYAKAGGLASESLSAIRTVTALNAQPDIISNYRKYLIEAMRIGIAKGLSVGVATGAMWFIVLCTYAVTLWYGSTQIADTLQYGYTDWPRAQTGGKVYAAFFACLMGAFGIGQLAPPAAAFTSARVAAKTFLNTIARKPLIDGLSEEGLKPNDRPTGAVQITNMTFSYPTRPDINVCKGYNLTIQPGQSCALVGPSGSGKSTIISLLLRFYDPNSGSVTLDGTDIRDFNTRWLRSQIGYVGQEPVLFSGTIAENIAFGLDETFVPEMAHLDEAGMSNAKEIIRERVIDSAKKAHAHDFIMSLPHGYETDVGSAGSSMSGGQKQRIAIARALIKKPAVLLLDEATSALDATSERFVQASIDELQQSKMQTTIVIAHRLSTIKNCDKIAVVSNGVIAEEGTHESLIAKNGLYADLVRLQMDGLEEPSDAATEAELLAGEAVVEGEVVEEVGGQSPHNKSAESHDTKDVSHSHAKSTEHEVVVAAEVPELKPELSKEESTKLSKKIWALIYKNGAWFFISILGAAMVGALFPLWGLILGKSLAVMFLSNPSELRREAAKQAGYFVGLAANSGIGAILQQWGIAQVGERIVMQLRSDFHAIIRREIGFFDQKVNSVGEITNRLATDGRVITKATGQTVAQQFQAVACLAIGLLIGFLYCWTISLVVLGCLIPMIISGGVKMAAYSGQLNELFFPENQVAEGGDVITEHSVISTAFTQMRTVSAFSVQFKVAETYHAKTRVKMVNYTKAAWIIGVAKGIAEFVTDAVFALLFFYAGYLLTDGDFTFEEVMVAIMSLMFASFGLGQALADLGDVKQGLEAASRIFKVIEDGGRAKIDGLSTAGIKPKGGDVRGRIELSNVNFAYPTRPDMQVCKEYNLTIEPGEMIALVGPSGSGKSTIMNLLLRFYDPLSGSVKFDGVDVKDLNVRWLRSQIGYVGQEPVLFRGTVQSNIAKGRAEFGNTPVLSLEEVVAKEQEENKKKAAKSHTHSQLSDVESGQIQNEDTAVPDDVLEAAKATHAHDFIMAFSDQYNTDVGESSMMVSGGQKQRIAIARALIKKPAVLLLDEATSALDATSERFVQESIDELQQSKMQTTIVIAHRLSTIKNADKIAVINHGKVVEIGKHDELIALKGLYAELWSKQGGAVPNSASKRNLSELAQNASKQNLSSITSSSKQNLSGINI